MNLQVVSWMLQAHWSKSEVQLPSHLPFIKLHDITSEASTSRFWEHFQNLDALGIPYNSNRQQGCCITVFVSQVAFVRKSGNLYVVQRGGWEHHHPTHNRWLTIRHAWQLCPRWAARPPPSTSKKKRHRIEEATVSRL